MTSQQKQLLKSIMGMMINVGMHRFIFFQITSNTLAADICQCWVWCDTSFKLSRYPAYIVLPITVTVINAFSSHRHLKCGTAKDLEANNMSELTTSCYVTIIKASHEVLNQTNVLHSGTWCNASTKEYNRSESERGRQSEKKQSCVILCFQSCQATLTTVYSWARKLCWQWEMHPNCCCFV